MLIGSKKSLVSTKTSQVLVVLIAALVISSAACDGSAVALDPSNLTIERLRGEVKVGDKAVDATSRCEHGKIVTGAEASAYLRLDDGGSILLDSQTELDATEDGVRLLKGRVLLEARDRDRLELFVGGSLLSAINATVSVSFDGNVVSGYVVRGAFSVGVPEAKEKQAVARGSETVRAGNTFSVTNGALTQTGAVAFADWTHGLAQAGPQLASSAGVGTLEARVPDEIGLARWPLTMRRLDVRVRVLGSLVVTEVDQEFFNPSGEVVEGIYRFRAPSGAVLSRFAVDRRGSLVDGYIREKAVAARAYQQQVYAGSTLDPALLEWDGTGAYRAKIYPIAAAATRRIVVRYSEWLPANAEGLRVYRYPMAGAGGGSSRDGSAASRIGEFSFEAELDARSTAASLGYDAVLKDHRLSIHQSDFAPSSDLVVELHSPRDAVAGAYRAPHEAPRSGGGDSVAAREADERDYFLVPITLPTKLAPAAAKGLDIVLVNDVSAGTDIARLELGREVTEAIVGRLGASDRLAILTSDVFVRGVTTARALLPATTENKNALLDALARVETGGATDVGAAIREAAKLLDPERQGLVVYIGDGAPTVGDMGANELLEAMARLPNSVRLYAVGVGEAANIDLLEAITHGGGFTTRVTAPEESAHVAMRLLAHGERPIAERVTVELGETIKNVYPRSATSLVFGETLNVVGRIDGKVPTSVRVRGFVRGKEFTETVNLTLRPEAPTDDLRVRWASARLTELIREGSGREAIVEIGTRYGLITPFTSFYVPSEAELSSRMVPSRSSLREVMATLLLAPFATVGCARNSEPARPAVQAESPPSFDDKTATEARPAPAEMQEQNLGNRAQGGEGARMRAPAPAVLPSEPSTPGASVEERPASAADRAADPASGAEAEALPRDNSGLGANEVYGTGRGGGGTGEGTIGLGTIGTIGRGSETIRGTGTGSVVGYGGLGRSASANPTARQVNAARPPDGAPPSLERPERLREERRSIANAEPMDRERDGRAYARDSAEDIIAVTTIIRTGALTRPRRVCSDAAKLPLDDRRSLWRERLSAGGSAAEWIDTLQRASRDCEVPAVRDRRAFLEELAVRAGSVESLIQVLGYVSDGASRGFLRSMILRRVRTAQELRMVRDAFGLGQSVDWARVEQVLAAAGSASSRVRALRELLSVYPADFTLKLRLMEELERAGQVALARRVGDRLRRDPLADAGVRTAVGEFYLRRGDETTARRVFSEIVEFAPMDDLARRRLGDLYRAHEWYEDAYRQYSTLRTLRPDDLGVLLLLAQAAAGAGRTDEALRLEQKVAESAPSGGAVEGLVRTALVSSSLRFAKMLSAARDNDTKEALKARVRRSGVLSIAVPFRAVLTWSHPEAGISLWAQMPPSPGYTPPALRPEHIATEYGVEAFEAQNVSAAGYRLEVRRDPSLTKIATKAELAILWNEGTATQRIEVVPLTFDVASRGYVVQVSDRVATTPIVNATQGGAR